MNVKLFFDFADSSIEMQSLWAIFGRCRHFVTKMNGESPCFWQCTLRHGANHVAPNHEKMLSCFLRAVAKPVQPARP